MIGRVIGDRYEIIEKLGEGGMANVYKAKCNILKRFISIKILKQEFSDDEEFVCKFKDEATEVAKLSNNNIVGVYDVGSEKNIHYIVMEYIDGKTLKEFIKESEVLSLKNALDFSIQICNALMVAHEINLIHRDIKSQNILISNNGIIKVTDFGIAKSPDSATITNSGRILGSAYYISPEQAKGTFVDGRTDIYSLGVVMYEMFVGRLPFTQGTPVNVALQHIQVEPEEPINFNVKLPIGINNLIIKCLQKNPNSRYQNIGELKNDLEELQHNKKYMVSKVNIYDSTKVIKSIKGKANNKKHKQNKKGFFMLLITILSLVLFIGVSSILISFIGLPGSLSKVYIPNIIGKSKNQAEILLKDLGLIFQISGVVSSEYEKDIVIDTYPKEGSELKKGDIVKVVLSEGVEKISVPDLTGKTLEEIRIVLQRNYLNIGEVEEQFSEVYETGKIIIQNPIADSMVEKNSEVNIIISKGSETKLVKIPEFIGLTVVEAENLASLNGIQIELIPIKTSKIENKDKIFYQSIPKDIDIKSHVIIKLNYYEYVPEEIELDEDTVDQNLEIEKHPNSDEFIEESESDLDEEFDVEKYDVKQVLVPDLRDMTIKSAYAMLIEIGLKLDYNGFKDFQLIKQVDYKVDESVPVGTEITVISVY